MHANAAMEKRLDLVIVCYGYKTYARFMTSHTSYFC